MRDFAYLRAASPQDAVAAATKGATIIAGGTELLNWMRLGIIDAESVIDIGRLVEPRGIARSGDDIRIGALATLNEVGESDVVRDAAPVLAQACLAAASPQLRNLATIGGNILQKTRCPYFRAEAPGVKAMPWPCNKRQARSGCAARDSGYPRLALFGGTETCVATLPSDPAVALAALNATIEIVGPGGPRSLRMTEFHMTQEEAARSTTGNRANPAALENRLRPGELIVAYRITIDAASRRSAYVKVRERQSYEYAMVSAAVAIDMDGTTIRSARIALGSVAQKPWRLTRTESALKGAPLQPAVLDRALDAALADARPLPGNEFKVVLARNTARRALMIAGGAA